MTLAPGSSLSHYTILGALGAGAMGEVWRARDTKLGREVAIKVLPEHFADDEERLLRFEREAKTLATLNHPNVAQIFGVDQVGDTCFLVLELVPGESLEERLARGPLPLAEALDVCRQIAEGLEAAHEAGVIHRDLKPANVRLTPEGKVKVLDFGLAKPAGEGRSGSSTDSVLSTEAGRLLGTPTYMAPEQARGKPIDKRVDVWAFGCVLYECLTARRAFEGETLTDVFAAVIEREPDWRRLPAATPAHVRTLLARCFAKDPRARLRDVGEARLLLGGALEAPEHAPAARRGTLALVALAAVVVGSVVGVAMGAWWLRAPDATPGPSAFRQLNLRPEAIFRARFAPDGKTVVYSAARSGNVPELFIVRPEGPEPQPLAMPRTHLLSVSARGDLAVLQDAEYIQQRLFSGTLARVPLGGGAPRPLLERVRDADWAPGDEGGERLAIIRDVDGKDRLEFPAGNVLVEAPGYLSDLRFDPAGERIAYFEHPARYDNRGTVHVVDLDGQSRVLTPNYWGLNGLAWSPDGRELFYSASVSGEGYSIFAVNADGATRAIYPMPGRNLIEDVNGAGGLLFVQDTDHRELLVRTRGDEREHDLAWLDHSVEGVLSQDGRTLAFTEAGAAMGTYYQACVRGTDGSPVVQLGEGAVLDLSRDGKWVLAVVLAAPQRLIAYPVGAGEPVELERGELVAYLQAQWFHDGARVLLNAVEPGAGPRYYVQDLRGGAPRPVTPEGTGGGRLAPDGKSVLALGPAGAYSLYPLGRDAGGEPRPVQGLSMDDRLVQWSDASSVLVARFGPVPCVIERVQLDSGRREPVLTLAPSDPTGVVGIITPYVSADLESYCYTTSRRASKLFMAEGAR